MDDATRTTKPPCLRDDALLVLHRLRHGGHIAYFAGGCVRDLLLGIEPKDYDVATDAPPDRVRELFANTQSVGQAFGVILVRQGRSVIEVATFRNDGRYVDGRHPQSIRFATAQEDALRRDFTINGLFLDPLNQQVIDYVDGQRDLNARLLRAIGHPHERFEEDHLRLLRAVRFASRFNLEVEPLTAQAIVRHAPQLTRISPERIAEELRLMLTPPTRTRAWAMLWEYDLIHIIFRSIKAEGNGRWSPDRSIFQRVDPSHAISFPLALAAGCLCFQWQRQGDPSTDVRTFMHRPAVLAANHALRRALKISNDESDRLKAILLSCGSLLEDVPPSLAAKKRFLASPCASDTQHLLRALRQLDWFPVRIDALQQDFEELKKHDCAPRPFITGDDLAAAGLRPGPLFKRILDSVYDAQLEDRVQNQQDAMALAMDLAKQHP